MVYPLSFYSVDVNMTHSSWYLNYFEFLKKSPEILGMDFFQLRFTLKVQKISSVCLNLFLFFCKYCTCWNVVWGILLVFIDRFLYLVQVLLNLFILTPVPNSVPWQLSAFALVSINRNLWYCVEQGQEETSVNKTTPNKPTA